ncbi:DUF6998 domain-containing protein [Aliiruegeria lutimaris]|uniref:DUF6998 domain-containing protein n=1 Tax=Aliiruegeria lutimaris TaxID=571298 RepID=UPI003CC7A4ED
MSIIFNGPGQIAWDAAGTLQSNGARPIRIPKLLRLNESIEIADRLHVIRRAPI